MVGGPYIDRFASPTEVGQGDQQPCRKGAGKLRQEDDLAVEVVRVVQANRLQREEPTDSQCQATRHRNPHEDGSKQESGTGDYQPQICPPFESRGAQ